VRGVAAQDRCACTEASKAAREASALVIGTVPTTSRLSEGLRTSSVWVLGPLPDALVAIPVSVSVSVSVVGELTAVFSSIRG
jgi:hypothetical protein